MVKKQIVRLLSQGAFFVLRKLDQYVTGSQSGIKRDDEIRDPYPAFKITRDRGHVLRSYTYRGWVVSGFEETQSLFRDTRFGTDLRKNPFLVRMLRLAADGKEMSFLDDPFMLMQDPPDHTRLRKLANHGFLNKHILSLEPMIADLVDQCLDNYDSESGQFNIISQLARPVPAMVIAKMLGLPDTDLPRFQALSGEMLGITALGNDELMDKGAEANREMMVYFQQVIEEKRAKPDQALVSLLIAAEEDGDRLSTEELYSLCILLLIAGHETTTRLIGNGMYLLLKHPDQLEKLRHKPDLTPNAVEEMLRYEPPVQFMPRFALQDVEFFGKKIKQHQLVVGLIASANRDESGNANPDKFDICRENIQHISFGYGIHLCLGMTLARLEGKVAIDRLLARFPNMVLAEQEFSWSPVAFVRGMDNLVIETRD